MCEKGPTGKGMARDKDLRVNVAQGLRWAAEPACPGLNPNSATLLTVALALSVNFSVPQFLHL